MSFSLDKSSPVVNIGLLAIFFACLVSASAKSSDPTKWPGHLEALGSAAEKKTIASVEGFPSPADFFDDYLSSGTPVLMKGAAKNYPAFSRWSDEYFTSFPESETYDVTAEQRKKENRTYPPETISFKTFVNTYREKDIYMVNGVPDFLQKDFYLPTPLLCGGYVKNNLQDRVMWFSSGGTSSVLHHDDISNINCLLRGTKDLIMIPYKYKEQVPVKTGGFSTVDVDKVDFTEHPGLHDVEYYSVHMEPGDCLHIPVQDFHQVRSSGVNIAVNVWFNAIKKFNKKDCEQQQPLDTNQSIDKFTFHAVEEQRRQEDEEEEDGNQVEGDSEDEAVSLPEDMREFFTELLGKDVAMNKGDYKQKLRKHEIFSLEGVMWSEELLKWVSESFNVLDSDGNAVITVKEATKWSRKKESKVEDVTQKLEKILGDMTATEPNSTEEGGPSDDEDQLNFEEDSEEMPNFTEEQDESERFSDGEQETPKDEL